MITAAHWRRRPQRNPPCSNRVSVSRQSVFIHTCGWYRYANASYRCNNTVLYSSYKYT